jgi:ankyrin repeat protein
MPLKKSLHMAAALILSAGISGQSFAAALADAAETGDWVNANSLLGGDVAVDEAQADGTTALIWAAYHRNADLARELLERGADANAENRYGMSALYQAAQVGDAALIGVLLEHGADANASMPEGDTPLMLAARSGSLEAVRQLLDAGAEVNSAESWHGETALIWATGENHADVVALLIERGADVGHVTTEFTWDLTQAGVASQLPRGGLQALAVAVREDALESAQVLIDHGADVNALDPQGISPLRVAIANQNLDMAMLLLDAGADPLEGALADAVKYSSFPMVRAAKNRVDETTSMELIERLHAANADVNAVPETPMVRMLWTDGMAHPNETPLWMAAQNSDIEMMQWLGERGADATALSGKNQSLLMAAMGLTPHQFGGGGIKPPLETDVALELGALALELGSSIDTADENGDTALHLAAQTGRADLIPFLIENGAPLDAKDESNRMPIDAANGKPGALHTTGGMPPAPVVYEEAVALIREAMAAQGIAEVEWVPAPPKEEEEAAEEAVE